MQLEPQTATHAAELYSVLSDPRLYQFTDDAPPVSLEALTERFRRLETRCSPDGAQAWLNWVIRREDGAAAGYVQATVHPDNVADIAFVLGRAFWGAGLAVSASRLMIAELVAEHGVRKVRASVDPRNARSLRLTERLGLRPIGQAEDGSIVLEALLTPLPG